jgi:hypothetical protein
MPPNATARLMPFALVQCGLGEREHKTDEHVRWIATVTVLHSGVVSRSGEGIRIRCMSIEVLSVAIPFCHCCVKYEKGRIRRVNGTRKLLGMISGKLVGIAAVSQLHITRADNFTHHKGRQFWVVAAERKDAGRFIVHADEMLIAFLELQAAIRRQYGKVG